MSRRYTRASSDRQTWLMGASEGHTFDVFTIAMVLNPAAVSANYNLFAVEVSGGGTDRCGTYINGFTLGYYTNVGGSFTNSASNGVGNNYVDVGSWHVLAVTKTSGTVAPRSHIFRLNDTSSPMPAMIHAAMGTAVPAVAAPGAGGQWSMGIYVPSLSDAYDGSVAAIGYWPKAMTDSECERLPRGRWAEFEPSFHVEYESGVDSPSRGSRDLSSGQRRQLAISGTSRSTLRDPPGFAFSAINRRR